jgi:hypothetical protein
MEYRIITDSGLVGLEDRIVHLLGRGWKLAGSLSVVYNSRKDETRFYQPIVRG